MTSEFPSVEFPGSLPMPCALNSPEEGGSTQVDSRRFVEGQ